MSSGALESREASWDITHDTEHRLRSENLAFDIDVWYLRLAHITPRTVFIPMRKSEAVAIKAYHDYTWRSASSALSPESIARIEELSADIDDVIRSNGWDRNGCFVRLCGRSPKDGEPFNRQVVWDDYIRTLQQFTGHCPDGDGDAASAFDESTVAANTRLRAITHASARSFRCCCGNDVMSLLITSERVHSDMIDWLTFGEPEQIVLREWTEGFEIENEFRLFVWEGKLTAASQYDHYAYYPALHEARASLQKEIQQWWQGVHCSVNGVHGSYVMDVAWFGNSKFVMIELSPFLPCTGSALFNWQHDAQLLRNGPYSLRLKDAHDVHPQMNELILCNWTSRWPLQDAKTLLPARPFTQILRDAQPLTIGHVVDAIPRALSSLFSAIFQPQRQRLFVYGTLKRGFQWNTKYMSERLGCSFVCEAVSVKPMPLVLGESGVPYLLTPQGDRAEADASQAHRIVGELWRVSTEALQGLDEYEGVDKGYYSRTTIPVCVNNGMFGGSKDCLADVYVLNNASQELVNRPRINEYTLEMHHRLYNAIVHVQRKQHAYLGWSASTWGKMPAREVGTDGATASS